MSTTHQLHHNLPHTQPINLHDAQSAYTMQIDPMLQDDDELFLPEDPQGQSQADIDAVQAITASLKQANGVASDGEEEQQGDQRVRDPPPHIAPFSRPTRREGAVEPEYMVFTSRDTFESWLGGESSWCHFVQRRTTTPEKRAEDRMKARVRTYEKSLSNMTPDEAANAPPLKKRRRTRVTSIQEKTTYTCHHAGSYKPQHSSVLPEGRLRMNTKKTVKCNCPSKVVLTVMQSGECKVAYYWRHVGHEPYAENEWDTGRLPKSVDDWLVRQIEDGKDTGSIMKLLNMSSEEKEELLTKAALAPESLEDDDIPPPLALNLKIKYPDIYNRYRKLKGPIKATKQLKTKRTRPNPPTTNASDLPEAGPSHTQTAPESGDLDPNLDLEALYPDSKPPPHGSGVGVGVDLDVDDDTLPMTDEQISEGFAQLAAVTGSHQDGVAVEMGMGMAGELLGEGQVHISEEMLRLAGIGTGAGGRNDEDGGPETAWQAMRGQFGS